MKEVVHKGALIAVVSDLVQSIAWRVVVFASMRYPSYLHDSHAPALVIRAVGALCLVAAASLVTRPGRSEVPMRAAGFSRVMVALSAAVHVLRLVLSLASQEHLVDMLEPVGALTTGMSMLGIALCVGSFFAAGSRVAESARARLLGAAYLVASSVSAALLAADLAHVYLGSTVGMVVSLSFLGLAIAAFALVRDLGRGAMTPA